MAYNNVYYLILVLTLKHTLSVETQSMVYESPHSPLLPPSPDTESGVYLFI